MLEDVGAAVAWYPSISALRSSPTLPGIRRRDPRLLRLLLSGPKSSLDARCLMAIDRVLADGSNRTRRDDLPAEVERLRAAGAEFRNDIVTARADRRPC